MDAFAAHTVTGNEKKSAYLFSIAGNSGALPDAKYYVDFFNANNGASHESAYNNMTLDMTRATFGNDVREEYGCKTTPKYGSSPITGKTMKNGINQQF